MKLAPSLLKSNPGAPWDLRGMQQALKLAGHAVSLRTVERMLDDEQILPAVKLLPELISALNLKQLVVDELEAEAKRKRVPCLVLQAQQHADAGYVLMVNDGRGGRRWNYAQQLDSASLTEFLEQITQSYDRDIQVWPGAEVIEHARDIVAQHGSQELKLGAHNVQFGLTAYQKSSVASFLNPEHKTPSYSQSYPKSYSQRKSGSMDLTHLDRLEAESIHIIREVMAESENPVMLYSIGKDSSVMLRLAQKAFYPSKPPFPLLHVDTRWKFQAMYEFRQMIADETGMDLIVHINPEGVEKNINPFDHGSALHTDIMKTQGLIQALNEHKFDAAFGGARRDEEKSRAKERVFSFRNSAHRWDPKNQRPELWNIYNGKKAPGESIRVFPLSNWTELDIWQYILKEDIPIVPLYFAAERPVIERDGMLMMVDDDRLKLFPDEKVMTKRVRFRTLGCYPLTGAIESEADTLPKILLELLEARTSERQGRAIDTDSSGSMEKKKQEGYF